MSGLARRLAPALPWALLLIVLLLAAVAVVLAVVLRRARRAAAGGEGGDGVAGEGEAPAREPLLAPAAASRAFARAVAALRGYVPGRDARYRIPWVAVMGPAGAGSSAVARGVDLPRPFAPPGDVDDDDPRGRAVRWHFFEQGVLLDVPGAWVREHGGRGHDAERWRTFLRLLERWRPDRPLDALVLTVPADELAGTGAPGRGEVLARAEAVRDRLWEAQRRLGVRLPVHVLVTRCDRLPGFDALCHELPERARHEIFGWSSPYPLQAAFSPQWVDEAFQSVHRDLYETGAELLAGCDPRRADGVFRFPAELRRLVPALRAYLGEVFGESVYHEAFFFRGLYFTGDPLAGTPPGGAPAPPAPAGPPPSARVGGGGDDDAAGAAGAPAEVEDPVVAGAHAHAPLFLRHLFAERVFAEAGLARVARGGARARGRWARAAQAAAALLLVVGLPGLLLAHRRLEETGDRIARSLRQATLMARVLDREGEGLVPATSAKVEVMRLMDGLVALPTGRLWSPFIPQSWPGGLRRTVLRAQAAAFGEAVLPAMRARLLARADALLPADPSDGFVDPDPDSVAAYLRALGALSENVNRYNRLATPGTADPGDLEALAAYLFGERVARGTRGTRAYRRALRLAAAQPLSGDRTGRALVRTGLLVDRVYARLAATLAGLEQELENGARAGGVAWEGGGVAPEDGGWDDGGRPDAGGRESGGVRAGPGAWAGGGAYDGGSAPGGGGVAAGGSARAAGFDPRRLGTYFAGGDSAWLAAAAPLPAAVDSALQGIPSSPLLSAAQLRSRVRERFASARTEQLSALESPGDGGNAPAARSLVALRDALATLRGQPFAGAGAPVRLMDAVRPPSAPVAWDTVALALALSRYDAYTRFVAGPQVAALSARSQALVRTLAAAQLEAAMTREVAGAAHPLPAPTASPLASGTERELRARVAALTPAAGLLARVAGAYAQAGRGAAYDDLGAFAATQGGAVLAGADRVLEALHYVPRDRGFGWWRGETPVSFPAFGVRDTAGLDEYLAAQRASVQRLYTEYAAPVLSLLGSDALAPFMAAPTPAAAGAAEAAARWAALGETLAKYESKAPNALSRLESLILDDMGQAAPGSCASVSAAVPGSDWFARRARWLAGALLARCRQLGAQWVRQGYAQLRASFNASLAGRFPFARTADGSPDADPQAVREFLALYGRMAAVRASVQSGRDGVGGGGTPAAAFLGEMDQAAGFLAPLVAADTGGGPAYRVDAEFRVNRSRETGADQVAEWAMQVGATRLSPRDSAAAGWSPGESVGLSFRWAQGSPVRPAAAGLPRGAASDGTTLTYGYGGEWALLRLLVSRGANPRERAGYTLAFPARTVAAPQAGGAAPTAGAAPGDALLFVRVQLLDPATRRPLALPRFPIAAPPLDGGDEP